MNREDDNKIVQGSGFKGLILGADNGQGSANRVVGRSACSRLRWIRSMIVSCSVFLGIIIIILFTRCAKLQINDKEENGAGGSLRKAQEGALAGAFVPTGSQICS